MKYEPFSELIKPYCEGPYSALPEELRQRFIDANSLLGYWDDLKPEARRSLAEQHDSQSDPARRDERNHWTQLVLKTDTCLQEIAKWERLQARTITEVDAKETKLTTLKADLAALALQYTVPFSALPAPVTEPDQPTPSPVTAPPASVRPRKLRARKPTIETVALDYMREVYRTGQFQSATKFHKHLVNKAGESVSPFEMGTGENARKLFCPAASSFFDPGTLGKMWAKIRAI